MPQATEMPRHASIDVDRLLEPALLANCEGDSVLANTAAIRLLGPGWEETAAGLARLACSRAILESWHKGTLSVQAGDQVCQFAVHVSAHSEGSFLLLLDTAQPQEAVPSAQLEGILESISDCFFALDGDSVFVYANSRAAEFFGRQRESLLGLPLLSLDPENSRFREAYDVVMAENRAITYDARLPELDKWIEIRAYPVDRGMAVYFSDITDRRSTQEQLSFLALHDPLTRLPNRRFLEDVLKRATAKAKRGVPSALLFLDMDNFKTVNDSVGHASGDAVLLEFVEVVGSCLRESDLLSRFGGDEFALLLEGTNEVDAYDVAERIRTRVREHLFIVGDRQFSLGVSIGMTLVDGIADQDRIMSFADDAMYEAKRRGGDRIVVFSESHTTAQGA